jgi:hypothetical protein
MPRSGRLRTGVCLAAVMAMSLTFTGPASAHEAIRSDDGVIDNAAATHGHDSHHGQHGGDEGHLDAGSANVTLVSKLGLRNVVPGKIADVGVHNGYAYLAAWGGETCKNNGVHVVDIRDVAAPREVAFVPSKEGSFPGEGVQAIAVSTPAFTGDILVTNNEVCKDAAGSGGMNIYNVTNPARPTPLSLNFGDEDVPGQGKKAANQIHSVFAWDAGDRAYAVIVDNEETFDVDIVDITDPKKPTIVREYDLVHEFPEILQAAPANLTGVFHHDMIVKEINGRQVMLISYWDGGYVTLDVTDPADATYIGDSDFALTDPEVAGVAPEGNAHQAEFTSDNRFILAADEDFSPYAVSVANTVDGTTIAASPGDGTPPLEPGQTIAGQSVFVGRACPGDPAVPAGPAGVQIAVVERGLCTFSEKVASVSAAGGWEAILVVNRTAPDGCGTALAMSVEGDVPSFGVAPREAAFSIFDVPGYDEAACVAGDGTQLLPIAIGTVGDGLSLSSTFDGWGYVHLFENNAGKLVELDTYAVPEAVDPAFAQDFGDLSVHEIAVSARPELAYVSYYAAGLRVIEVVDGQIVERGHFIDEGGNNFWGVQTFTSGGREYVAASDRDLGLYIFEYTPGG